MISDIIKTAYHIIVLNVTKSGDGPGKCYNTFDKFEQKKREAE